MHVRQQLLEEFRRLESSLSVLIEAARLLPKDTPEAEFYIHEIPLAIEDAELGMLRISQLISALEMRIAQANRGETPDD